MAPESPGNLIALDLEWNNSRLECQVERYDNGGGFLYVSWNALECPENYLPIGNNVAYAWFPDGFTKRNYRARIDPRGNGFEWIDVAQYPYGAMLILTLPPNYSFEYSDDTQMIRSPVSFKPTQENRIAFYWWVEPGRFEVNWQMNFIDVDSQCQLLNREALRRMQPNTTPPHIDLPPGQGVNVPSHQPQTLPNVPEWHREQQFRMKLFDRFNLAELQNLCHDFGISYEIFPREKDNFVRELIEYFDRRGKKIELVDYCRQQRPSESW